MTLLQTSCTALKPPCLCCLHQAQMARPRLHSLAPHGLAPVTDPFGGAVSAHSGTLFLPEQTLGCAIGTCPADVSSPLTSRVASLRPALMVPLPLPADSLARNSSTSSLPGQVQGPGMRPVGSSLSLRSATSPRMGTQGSCTLQDGAFFGQQQQHQPQGYGPGPPGRRNLGSMSMSTGDLTALYEAQAQQARVSGCVCMSILQHAAFQAAVWGGAGCDVGLQQIATCGPCVWQDEHAACAQPSASSLAFAA